MAHDTMPSPLHALTPRGSARSEAAAGAALLLLWVLLWSWLIAGVATPSQAARDRVASDGAAPGAVVTVAR